MSLRHALIEACVKLRGASAHQIVDYLDFQGVEYNADSVHVNLYHLVKLNLLRKERTPCKGCKCDVTFFFATDEARITYL